MSQLLEGGFFIVNWHHSLKIQLYTWIKIYKSCNFFRSNSMFFLEFINPTRICFKFNVHFSRSFNCSLFQINIVHWIWGDHRTNVGSGGLGLKLKMSGFFGLDKALKISGGFGLKVSARKGPKLRNVRVNINLRHIDLLNMAFA